MPKHAAPNPQLPRRRELRNNQPVETIEVQDLTRIPDQQPIPKLQPVDLAGLLSPAPPTPFAPIGPHGGEGLARLFDSIENTVAAPTAEPELTAHTPVALPEAPPEPIGDAPTPSAPYADAHAPSSDERATADQRIELVTPLPHSSTLPAAPITRRSWGPKRILAATSAFAAASALMLTTVLPGVQPLPRGTGHVSTLADGQGLSADDVGDFTATFDALNSVIIEAGEGLDTFVNYRDAAVQYPFAEAVPLSDPFGERSWPVAGLHDAQDFAAADGTQVQAIADGTVLEAGFASDGCGFGLKLEHEIDDQLVTSRYCHMQVNSHTFQVGDAVAVGDPVGNVGNTGLSFGSHLHFALTIDGEAVDPMPFLAKYNRLTRAT